MTPVDALTVSTRDSALSKIESVLRYRSTDFFYVVNILGIRKDGENMSKNTDAIQESKGRKIEAPVCLCRIFRCLFAARTRKNHTPKSPILDEEKRLELLKDKLEPRSVQILSFHYDKKNFGNMLLCLEYNEKLYEFILDQGEVVENKRSVDAIPSGQNDFWGFLKCVENRLFGTESAEKLERSCGAVVFTRKSGQFRYLLVQNPHGVYGFPKGHMEGTETELETATREIREETGLQVRYIDGFHTYDIYPSPKIEGWMKRVDYFLAEFEGQEYHLQASEIAGGGLYTFGEAMELLQYGGCQRILQEADKYLQDK